MLNKLHEETQMIEKIKIYGYEIFNTEENTLNGEQSFNFQLSQSSNDSQIIKHIQQPLTIKPKKQRLAYGSQYVSPYSKGSLKEYPTSRVTVENNMKIAQQIKNKLTILHNEDKHYETLRKRSISNKSYQHVKPKYLKKEPVVKNLDPYVKKNFYGKNNENKTMSRKDRQKTWNSFIKNEQEWNSKRKKNITRAQIEKAAQIDEEVHKRPKRKEVPQPTIDECLGRLRRQTIKLKEQLENHRFEPVLYQTERIRLSSTSKSLSKKKNLNSQRKTEKKIPVIKNPLTELKFMLS